jgi:hypothetical protein
MKAKTVKDNIVEFVRQQALPVAHACYILALVEMAGGDPLTLTTTPSGPSDPAISLKFTATMQKYVDELEPGGMVLLGRGNLNDPITG